MYCAGIVGWFRFGWLVVGLVVVGGDLWWVV